MIVELGIGGRLVTLEDWVYVLLIYGAALGLGVALRVQTERSIALAVAADRAQREQEATAQAAVQEERARIARELHDVVAHNVGLIVLQAGGARSVLATDPERARTALQQVEETGRQTLAEMRHLVGILRVDEGADRQPLPRLDRLPALVDEARAARPRRSTCGSRAQPVELPAGLELAAYRLIQEALTNVRKHAPTSTRRRSCLGYEPDRLRIEVTQRRRDRQASCAIAAPARAGLGPRPDRDAGAGAALRRPDAGRTDAHPAASGSRRSSRVARGVDMTIDLVIVDDQPLARAGLRMILESQPDLRIVGEGSDGAEAVGLVRRLRPNVAILDVRMPRMDGLEATRRIVAIEPATRILILTTFDLDEYAFEALRAGASGFLLKDAPAEDIVHAVHAVARGDATLAPAVTRRLVEHYAARPRPDAFPALATLTAARARGPAAAGGRRLERGHRRPAGAQRGDREDPRRPRPGQARRPRSGAGGDLRLRVGPRRARRTAADIGAGRAPDTRRAPHARMFGALWLIQHGRGEADEALRADAKPAGDEDPTVLQERRRSRPRGRRPWSRPDGTSRSRGRTSPWRRARPRRLRLPAGSRRRRGRGRRGAGWRSAAAGSPSSSRSR